MCRECGAYFMGVVMEGCVVLNDDVRGYCIVVAGTKIYVVLHFI